MLMIMKKTCNDNKKQIFISHFSDIITQWILLIIHGCREKHLQKSNYLAFAANILIENSYLWTDLQINTSW